MLILVQRPQHRSTPDPVAAPKNIPFGTIFIEFGDTKKCCTFSGLELAPKSRKKLTGTLSCMHKGSKCIQSLWDHPKKIPFVQKNKEGAICAILREKTPFWAFPEAKTGVLKCARLRKAAQRPNNNANPSGISEKKFILEKVFDFVDKVGISVLRGVGWVPQKSADFDATAPAQKHASSRCGFKSIPFGTFFSNLAILKHAALFQGLN